MQQFDRERNARWVEAPHCRVLGGIIGSRQEQRQSNNLYVGLVSLSLRLTLLMSRAELSRFGENSVLSTQRSEERTLKPQ